MHSQPRKKAAQRLSLLAVSVGVAAGAQAGPGTVVIKTEGDITATLGGQVRIIPTSERNWDFGISKFGDGRFKAHTNEGGVIRNDYIRTEDRLYFNFAKGDIWDVYMALEFDSSWAQQRVDRAQSTQGPFGDFGIERLNASVKLPSINSRFNAGWDVYGVDTETGLIYTDDDPGLYIKGGSGAFTWQAGFHKKIEGDFIPSPVPAGFDYLLKNRDRNIYTARANFKPSADWEVGLIYALDDLKVRGGVVLPTTIPDVKNSRVSAIAKASLGPVRLLGQGVYSFGRAKQTGVVNVASPDGAYDIRASAFAGDVAWDAHKSLQFSTPVVPHFGFYYASGDKNPNDRKLGGYTAIVSIPRFGQIFGGENTILYDGNAVAGSTLYGNLPEFHGNQNVTLGVGGLTGTGRGDNPGLLQIGGGVTVGPFATAWLFQRATYRTNVYALRWNADFTPAATPPLQLGAASAGGFVTGDRAVRQRLFGVAWDNEFLLEVDKNMFLKAQASLIRLGAGGREAAASLGRIADSSQISKTASRLAVEMLWNF